MGTSLKGKCVTCKFFTEEEGVGGMGSCHAHPPAATVLMVPQGNAAVRGGAALTATLL